MLHFLHDVPALLLTGGQKRTLVIPDLHLGLERGFAERGINLPTQTERVFARLQQLIAEHGPQRLLFLGDIKHGTSKIHPEEWASIPRLFERLLALTPRIDIVPGNHDGGLRPLLPPGVEFHAPQGFVLEVGRQRIGALHGHTWPSLALLDCDVLLMGHHHFTLELHDPSGHRRREPVWAVSRWHARRLAAAYLRAHHLQARGNPVVTFQRRYGVRIGDPRIIVMPAFQRLLSGLTLNRKARPEEYLGPLLSSGAIDMARAELYLLDGTLLGTLRSLPPVATA